MARIGLALSGGGSKGAFTVGVLEAIDVLLDPVPYPVIAGTSTGALIGTMLTTNQFARLVEIYSKVETENIVNPNHALVAGIFGPEAVLFTAALAGKRAIFNTDALRATIAANIDFAKIVGAAGKTRLIYTTVDLQSGKDTTFDNATHPPEVLAEALLASANMPVLTDPVDIPVSGGTHQFVDGGVREFLPLGAVFDSGIEVDHIIAISTSPLRPKPRRKPYDNIIDILGRTVDLLNAEVAKTDYSTAQFFNSMLLMIENAEKNGFDRNKLLKGIRPDIRAKLKDKRAVPVTFIGPNTHIDMDSLTFEPTEMGKWRKKGIEVGKRLVPKIVKALEGDGG